MKYYAIAALLVTVATFAVFGICAGISRFADWLSDRFDSGIPLLIVYGVGTFAFMYAFAFVMLYFLA